MAWQDRVGELAYTSPAGVRITATFEDVGKTFDKRGAAFEFPDANGTYIQDLGHSGRRFPLRWIFHGPDHDLEADVFEEAIREPGIGRLEHPFYGQHDVIPFGTISRRDDLKTAANQTILELEMWETIGIVYPTAQVDPASQVNAALARYQQTAAAQFADSVGTGTAIERASLRNNYNAILDRFVTRFKPLVAGANKVAGVFDAIKASIDRGINVLIADPITLALQTIELIKTPGRILGNAGARLDAYGDLARAIIRSPEAVNKPSNDKRPENQFFARDLVVSGEVAGAASTATTASFNTRPEAIQTAEGLLDLHAEVTQWREENYKSLELIDTGEATQQLLDVVALSAGYLVEVSFSLKQERAIVLDRNRTILDLSAELYGRVDQELDFLIRSNNLSGSEILELPRGRRILYYV